MAGLALATIAFNLTRAAVTLTDSALAESTTRTIRGKLVNLAARIASSARRIMLNLPKDSPSETAWTTVFNSASGPPKSSTI